jgi:hypothetical protein
MRHSVLAATAAVFALATAAPALAASYLPVGPQTNVSMATVTGGGWSLCYSEPYGQFGTSIASILAGCGGGTRLMMAGRETGSQTISLLAQAPRADVLFAAGTGENTSQLSNGSQWYFDDSYSWGFANGGDTVYRISCDFPEVPGDTSNIGLRLCWHTGAGNMNGGFRVGSVYFLNNEPSGYEKLLFVDTGGAVPEPASWAMLIAGFGLVGAAARRRRATVAA